jgi:hypothetical protein
VGSAIWGETQEISVHQQKFKKSVQLSAVPSFFPPHDKNAAARPGKGQGSAPVVWVRPGSPARLPKKRAYHFICGLALKAANWAAL